MYRNIRQGIYAPDDLPYTLAYTGILVLSMLWTIFILLEHKNGKIGKSIRNWVFFICLVQMMNARSAPVCIINFYRLLAWCIICWPLPICNVWAQPISSRFEYLSTSDGLAQNHVFHVMQDAEGFMWFSTMNGLSQYDGFSFTNFYSEEDDSTTLSASFIHMVLEDSHHRFWVATQNGFNGFDRRTGKCVRYMHKPDNQHSPGHPIIRALTEDQHGHIWMVHDRGVDRFDPVTGHFRHFLHNDFSVARNAGAIDIDASGTIWAVGLHGLFRVDQQKQQLIKVAGFPDEGAVLPSEGRTLFIDEADRIWVGYRFGLRRYFPEDGRFEQLDKSLFSTGITCVTAYSPSVLAIATLRNGLVLWDTEKNIAVTHMTHDPCNVYSIRNESIYSVYVDNRQNLWLGLFYGVNMAPPARHRFDLLENATGLGHFQNFILRVVEDAHGGIWSHTMDGLMYRAGPSGESEEVVDAPHFPAGYKTLTLAADPHGKMYIAWRPVGLFIADARARHLQKIEEEGYAPWDSINVMYCDPLDSTILWISHPRGIARFSLRTKHTDWIYPPQENLYTPQTSARALTFDDQGDVWYITSGQIFNINRLTLQSMVHREAGLIPGVVQGIGYHDPYLWIGTNRGVYRFHTLSGECDPILYHDGQPVRSAGLVVDHDGKVWSGFNSKITRIDYNEVKQYVTPTDFVNGIGSLSADGDVWFGGEKGMLHIRPNSFVPDTAAPGIAFRGIRIDNQPTELDQLPEYTQRISLDHTARVITMQYAAMHFLDRQQIRYAYMLEGFDSDWIDAGTRQEVTYTKLPPGHYLFKAKAITEDQIESRQPLMIKVYIRPAYYQTMVFRLLMVAMATAIILVLYGQWRRVEFMKKQRTMEEQQAAYRSRFLANMSHEIRTPLQAITGLNTLMLSTPLESTQRQYTQSIHYSCDQLLWMVNDILDQSKIENGSYQLVPIRFQLQDVMRQVEAVFRHLVEEKGLAFQCNSEVDSKLALQGDPVRLVQILSNLLSNALKFTHQGHVGLTVSSSPLDHDHIECVFTVTDTGIGIPDESRDAIFERFYQVHDHQMTGSKGTGLGLSIVKHLVELMKGQINVTSVYGEGTTFAIRIPFALDRSADMATREVLTSSSFPSGLRILLVDDTPLNQFTASALIRQWLDQPQVDIAADGISALKKIAENSYNFILMDVVMPGIDGLETTRRIRRMTGAGYAKIPIIGLTANVVDKQQEDCMKAGMNGFICKPMMKPDFYKVIQSVFV